jgi:hypothetical protein
VAVNLRDVFLSEIAGLAWLVAVLGVALIARRHKPFASPTKVRQAWVLFGVTELVGIAFGLVSGWLASSSLGPPMPVLFVAVQIVFLLALQTAFFAWVSKFPVLRLLVRGLKRRVSGSGGRLG